MKARAWGRSRTGEARNRGGIRWLPTWSEFDTSELTKAQIEAIKGDPSIEVRDKAPAEFGTATKAAEFEPVSLSSPNEDDLKAEISELRGELAKLGDGIGRQVTAATAEVQSQLEAQLATSNALRAELESAKAKCVELEAQLAATKSDDTKSESKTKK